MRTIFEIMRLEKPQCSQDSADVIAEVLLSDDRIFPSRYMEEGKSVVVYPNRLLVHLDGKDWRIGDKLEISIRKQE